MTRPRPDRRGVTLVEVLVVIGLYGLLLALMFPAIQRVREAAGRVFCQSRLRQMGIALQLFHHDHDAFPPGCSSDHPAHAFPHMSWLTRLLPYLEHQQLWEDSRSAFAQARFFMDPPHRPILGKPLPLFACPTDERLTQSRFVPTVAVAFTSYLGVLGVNYRRNDGMLFLDSKVRLADVHDGTSNTLLVGERPPGDDGVLGWWYGGWGQDQTGALDFTLGVSELNRFPKYQGFPPGPYEFGPGRADDPRSSFHFWSLHHGGAHFLFVDGSVRFLHYSVGPRMEALATRSGLDWAEVPD